VRALSVSEVARLVGFDNDEIKILLSWHKDNPIDTEFLVGSTTPRVVTRAILLRARARLSMWHMRKKATLRGLGNEMRASGGPRRTESGQPYDQMSIPGLAEELVRSGLELPSRITYRHAFKGWEKWRIDRGLPVVCSQLEGDQDKEEQDWLEFVAAMGLRKKMSHATIRVMLFAVRRFHVENGLKDPLENKRRLHLAMEGC
jgi:hypothetical protein